MKKITPFALIILCILFFQCKNGDKDSSQKKISSEIILKNDASDSLTDKPIEIPRSKLILPDSSTAYPVLSFNDEEIPSQLSDTDQDGKWDVLFLVADFTPNEEKDLKLEWVNKKRNYPARTSVRFGKRETLQDTVAPLTADTLTKNEMTAKQGFQKYQTDGPSWENDKAAFRMYLDGRYSKDVYGKRVPDMSPEDVGINDKGAVEDNYHVMEDWGRDILSVGNSVGAGGFALMVNDTVRRLGGIVTDTVSNVERTYFDIQEEGPVKSVLSYKYEDWSAGGNTYNAKENTTIWPGIYGFKNTVSISGLKGDEQLAVGLVNIDNQNPLVEEEVNGDWVALITHDRQTYNREWILGLALILPKDVYNGYIEAPKTGKVTDTYLAKLSIENNKPVSYYVIAGWELSQQKKFSDPEFFKQYVVKTAKELSANVEITVK